MRCILLVQGPGWYIFQEIRRWRDFSRAPTAARVWPPYQTVAMACFPTGKRLAGLEILAGLEGLEEIRPTVLLPTMPRPTSQPCARFTSRVPCPTSQPCARFTSRVPCPTSQPCARFTSRVPCPTSRQCAVAVAYFSTGMTARTEPRPPTRVSPGTAARTEPRPPARVSYGHHGGQGLAALPIVGVFSLARGIFRP